MNTRPDGFSLLEVLVALVLLAGVVTTIIVTFNRHLQIAVQDDAGTTALLLTNSLITDPTFFTRLETSGSFPAPHQRFKWKREPQPTELPSVTAYRVTVRWGAGSTEQVSLSTYVPSSP